MKTSLIFTIIALSAVNAYVIDTIGEALVVGQWRTTEDLLVMSHEDERNTLITELTFITNESVEWLQSNNDDALTEIASVSIFLRDAEVRNVDELATMTVDDQRNTLITQLHYWTDEPVSDLQAKSSNDLVAIGCAFMDTLYTAAEVVSFEWDVDSGQLTEEIPELLSEQLNNNCNSSVALTSTFTFSKTITESTTFEYGGEFQASANILAGHKKTFNFKALRPRKIFKKKVKSRQTYIEGSITLGGTKTWGNQELNAISETYSDSINVSVPPGEAILIQAMTMITKMDVPYTMTVKTALNTTEVITGIWKGVSMAEFQRTQVDVPCDML